MIRLSCPRFGRRVLAAAFTLIVIQAGISRLSAQATAVIAGTVTDTSGAAIGETSLQVRNTGTDVTRTIQTNAQGHYIAPDLVIGTYEIQASKPGFATEVRRGITLTVGAEPVVDFQLQVGQQTQTVTVEGEVSAVETQSTEVGSLVESKQVRDLPLNGRNFTQLLTLAPNVTQITQGAPGAGGTFSGNGQKYSIAGSRVAGEAFLLDDQDMVNFWNDGPGAGGIGTALGVEAIAEFQTLLNTYTAQFGGNGAVINASSRAGTNAFHGSLYEFLRNNKMEDRNEFDSIVQPGATKAVTPTFRQNQFGASAGGPIKKDKIFFFANYEGLRKTHITNNIVTVPDACVHNAVASGAGTTAGCLISATTNPNPAINQEIQNLMALYPLPNFVSSLGNGTGRAVVANPEIGNENYLLGRMDYTLSDKSSIFLRYVLDHADRTFYESGIPLWPEQDLTRDHFVSLEQRYIFSPRLVNAVHLGYSRTFETAYDVGSPTVANGVASQGTGPTPTNGALSPGVHPLQFWSNNPSAINYVAANRPDGAVTAGSNVSLVGPGGTLPFYMVPNKYQFGDDVIWTTGAHSFTAGVTGTRLDDNTSGPYQLGPQWVFSSLPNFVAGNPATVTGGLSDSQNPFADATRDYRYWVFGLYAQDQWKATRKLTVNAGLRYSPTSIISMVTHQNYNLVDAPYGVWVPLKNSTADNLSLHNWDPRVGLAYDPFSDHKTAIRASFGMFHNVVYSRDTDNWLSPPWLSAVQSSSSTLNGAPAPISFPVPYTNVPRSSGTLNVPLDGSISCNNCDYYGLHSTPYAMQWNFNIQREVMPNTLLTVGYIGSHNIHLFGQRDFNSPVPFIGPSGRPTFGVYSAASNAIVANPRANPYFSVLNLMDAFSTSHYEALQASLNHRYSSNFQTLITYTYSKSIDNGSGNYGAGLDGGGVYNPTNLHYDQGLSNFSRTQNFRVSGVYSIPFKAKGFLGQAVNGWQVTGVFTALSGAPFSVGTIANRVDNSAGTSASRPDVVAGCNLYAGFQTRVQWFNPACFTPAPVGTYGNAGRDTIIGPGLWALDDSLTKDWRVSKISEQFTVQFRAEFFNILNHPTFQNPPNANVFNSSLSSAVLTNPLAGTVSNGTTFAGLTATNSQPRQIQLALKIIF